MRSTTRLRTLSMSLGLAFLAVLGLILWFAAAEPGRALPTAVTFKDQDGLPISGPVRVLCYAGDTAVTPFADLNLELLNGLPSAATPLPGNCSHLAALRLRHSQPSAKHSEPAYEIYATSWEPGATRPYTATGDIIISDLRPLTLLNLVASLGWTPAPNSAATTAADVRAAMQQTSAELYDWTEGQMAIGQVSVNTGGGRWDEADLRFSPANDKRPSAFIGGIVPEPITYTGVAEVAYVPAMVYLGRLWDGRDAFDEVNGRWTSQNAVRTLAHELAHYALFLYDEYQSDTGASGYCICDALAASGCRTAVPDASAMAYHYRVSEFWHKDTHLTVENFCYDTWQYHVHGQPDWDTLANWHAIQGLPIAFQPLRPPVPMLQEGPALGLTAALFDQQPGYTTFLPAVRHGATAVAAITEPLVDLKIDGAVPTATWPSQVYLLKDGHNPTRILPMGRATGDPAGNVLGNLRLLDVEPGDTVRAFAQRPALGGVDGRRYTLFTDPAPGNEITVQVNPWQFTLEHQFEVVDSQVAKLTLQLKDEDGLMAAPAAQICSLDTAVGCHPDWSMPMTLSGSGWWEAQFAPLPNQPELPRYLVARIWDSGSGVYAQELVQWLQVSGGVGPTHKDGMAPLLDDGVMVNVPAYQENAGDCNLVSYMPAANTTAVAAPLPPGFGGLLGIPLDITITLAGNGCPQTAPGKDNPLPVNTAVFLNLGYSQDEVDRLSLTEPTDLAILYYNRTGAPGWTTVQQIDANIDLNWLVASIDRDGIYAIGWRP